MDLAVHAPFRSRLRSRTCRRVEVRMRDSAGVSVTWVTRSPQPVSGRAYSDSEAAYAVIFLRTEIEDFHAEGDADHGAAAELLMNDDDSSSA